MKPGAGQPGRGLREAAAAAPLLLGFALLAVTAADRQSLTFDETAHLTAGYSYWTLGDFRLHPENGNLPQRLAALPSLALRPRFPPLDRHAWVASAVYEVGDEFLFTSGNDTDRMARRGRRAMVLMGVGLGVAIFTLSRRRFGLAGGILSLALYAFDPNFLAHGALLTSDVSSAVFFLLAAVGIGAAFQRPRPAVLAGSCLAWAGAFLCKMSAVLLVPVAILLLALRLWRPPPADRSPWGSRRAMAAGMAAILLLHGLAAAGGIWAFHDFRFGAFHAGRSPQERFEAGTPNLLGSRGLAGRAVSLARRGHLLPEAWLYGFSFAADQSRARLAFLDGEVSTSGWRRFFPYAFAVKTPEPLMAALLVALGAAVARRRRAAGSRQTPAVPGSTGQPPRLAPLWALLGVYAAAALATPLNIGHRHLLPLYPPLYILAGAAATWPGAAARSRRLAVGTLAGGALLVGSLAWPSYLAYFNASSGGPSRGWKRLVDSSLDWGQGLPALAARLADGGSRQEPVYLSYFGTARPEHYGVHARRLPGFMDLGRPKILWPLEPGLYALSASMLQLYAAPEPRPWSSRQEAVYQDLRRRFEPQVPDGPTRYSGPEAERFDRYRLGRLCAWLQGREPDEVIAGSILLFYLDREALRAALQGPLPHGGAQTVD